MLRYIIYLRQKNKPVFSLNQTTTLERTKIMSKGMHLEGADDRGDGKYEAAWKSGDQLNHITGEKDSKPDNHCHMYNNPETGKSGVVHRGECAVCDDNKSSGANTYGKIGDNEPSGGSSSGSDGGGSDGNTGNSGGK